MLLGQGSLPLYPQAACPASPPAFSVGSPMEAVWSTGPRGTIRLCTASSSILTCHQGLCLLSTRRSRVYYGRKGRDPTGPRHMLEHRIDAYQLTHPLHRGKRRCSKQTAFCRHGSCYTAFWQALRFVLQPCHSPPLSCSSLPSRTTSTEQATGEG